MLALDESGCECRDDACRIAILASGVVLATGGLGQVYRFTTNPTEVTGDGIAIAARAGARVIDLEFVQFHPTALHVEPEKAAGLKRSALLTEALRGAGAHLINEHGERFMLEVHPDAELAPRDLVARTNWKERAAGHEVFLDVRHIGDRLETSFPTVLKTCAQIGLDPYTEPIPVSPACHYTMGGIEVDAHGRSSLSGLWACGEASSTGVHGANRLASNSLLEGLVFGARVAATAARAAEQGQAELDLEAVWVAREASGPVRHGRALDEGITLRARLRDVMWDKVGLVRDRAGMESALEELAVIRKDAPLSAYEVFSRASGELRNLVLCSRLLTEAALRREESRGSHNRSDFPPHPCQLAPPHSGALG